jgi:proteasome lid subunit RPN8/RPN11
VDKVETLQELVDERRENQRLRKKLKRKRRWKKFNRAVNAVAIVSLAILFTRVTPVDIGILEDGSNYEVVISEEQVDVFDQHYTTELENGFCLYGEVEEEQVVVDEVVYVDDPLKQSRGAISFTCIPETLERLPKLLTHGDFEFLGVVHTHPSGSPRLSLTDAANTLGMARAFVKVSGVYNGDRVDFYTFEDPRVAMPLQVY